MTPGLAAALLLLSAQLPEPVALPDGAVSLSPGRTAELLRGVDGSAGPKAPLVLDWPAWSDRSGAAWGGEIAWRRWVELVRAEAAAQAPEPARRARLAALARLQGRDSDAWHHLEACASDPGTVAALFPLFLPGVPAELLGHGPPWPEGVLLAPALPPTDEEQATLRGLFGRVLEHRAVAIGGALVSLRVDVDRDGVGVELANRSGVPVRVRVRPPMPLGVEPAVLFADWEKRLPSEREVEFLLEPLAPTPDQPEPAPSEHSLWLTFHAPEAPWPHPLASDVAPLFPGRELVLVSPRGDEPHLVCCADALSELLGLRTRLARAGAERGSLRPGELEPVVLRLDEPGSAERKLASLLGQAEAFALRR